MARSRVSPTSACIAGMTVANVLPSLGAGLWPAQGQAPGLPGNAATWVPSRPPRRPVQRRCHAHLDAEIVRSVRLAIANAFDLRRVQEIDPRSALAMVLVTHAAA